LKPSADLRTHWGRDTADLLDRYEECSYGNSAKPSLDRAFLMAQPYPLLRRKLNAGPDGVSRLWHSSWQGFHALL
jgi:hypothetical protein